MNIYTDDTLNKEIEFSFDGQHWKTQYKDIGTFTPFISSNAIVKLLASMIFKCIEFGDLERIKLLINMPEFKINNVYYVVPSHKGNINMKRTVLMYAVDCMRLDVVKFLIASGANIHINHMGITALRLASITVTTNNPMGKEIYDYLRDLCNEKIQLKKPVKRTTMTIYTISTFRFWLSLIMICGLYYICRNLSTAK